MTRALDDAPEPHPEPSAPPGGDVRQRTWVIAGTDIAVWTSEAVAEDLAPVLVDARLVLPSGQQHPLPTWAVRLAEGGGALALEPFDDVQG